MKGAIYMYKKLKTRQYTVLNLIFIHFILSLISAGISTLFQNVNINWFVFVFVFAIQTLGSLITFYFINGRTYQPVSVTLFATIFIVSSIISLIIGLLFSFLMI